ncbi:MAG: serine/threonine protein kinase [Planctomycetes bacterium]|nr:serine/threonine protein kinase [Planctomycetota bacterium]
MTSDGGPSEKNTTVICGRCGVAYVSQDSDGTPNAHFCEVATAPTIVAAEAPTPGAPGASVEPSRSWTAREPDEVRAAGADPQHLMGQYVLVKQIGKGGMGTVWKAWDRTLSRWVAIKFLSGTSADEMERFRREAQLAAKIRHPNIGSVFEIGQARGQSFIAMEFIDGDPLDRAKRPLREILEIFRQVAAAMDAAHKEGIVHRDLKPQNIMVTRKGWPYVLDFGLAKQVTGDDQLSQTGMIMGSPAYMPPEQAEGHVSKVDARSDVYSLGATLYAVVAGQPPFKAATPMGTVMRVIQEEPVHPARLNASCPDEVATIILKAMEKDPARRYQSVAELAEDLRRFLNDEPLLARPPSVVYRLFKNIKRNRARYAVGTTIALAGVIVALSTRGGGRREEFEQAWEPVRRALVFVDFKAEPIDADRARRALEILEVLGSEDIQRVADQFQEQERVARGALEGRRKSEWLEHRGEFERIAAWARAAREALALGPDSVREKTLAGLASLERDAAERAAYRGQFTLLIHVAPFARVRSLRSGSDEIVGEREVFTPAALGELDVRDYELVLEHPELGSQTVRIPAGDLENGAEVVVSGDMGRPGAVTLKRDRR